MTLKAKFSDKDLAKAKAARDAKLERLKTLVDACVCMWPVRVNRNLSGHDGGCPAHKLFMDRWEEERS